MATKKASKKPKSKKTVAKKTAAKTAPAVETPASVTPEAEVASQIEVSPGGGVAPEVEVTPEVEATPETEQPTPEAPEEPGPVERQLLSWDKQRDPVTALQRQMQRDFEWTSDKEGYGLDEHWGPAVRKKDGKLYDDCDGYMLYAFDHLAKSIPNLRRCADPIVCRTEDGIWHTFLCLYTDDGLKAIDNRQSGIPSVGSLWRAGYRDMWRPKAGQAIDGNWVKFDPNA